MTYEPGWAERYRPAQVIDWPDCRHTLHPGDAEPCGICHDPNRRVERYEIADETPSLVLFICTICRAANRRVTRVQEDQKLEDWIEGRPVKDQA